MGVLIKDIADELGYASKEIIEKAQEMGFKRVKTASKPGPKFALVAGILIIKFSPKPLL